MAYGGDRGRYDEPTKRVQPDKSYGPLIATHMTRCIQCTRCVRFITEVAGTPVLGALGRGEHMEVTRYVGSAVSSELSGNLIDLCPVGALTNKPAAYSYRSWELTPTPSIDAMDALGAAIRIDSRGNEVIRILPRINEDINEEWLGDRSRFSCDGLKRQRLDRPWVRKDGRLAPASWAAAFAAIRARLGGLPGRAIAAIAGDQADCESMIALKDLLAALGSENLDCRQDGAALDPSLRASYLFNSTLAGIERADALLLIGTNPRIEAPLLAQRLRKRWLVNALQAASVGPPADLTFAHDWLGDRPALLDEIACARHPFAATLRAAKFPALILGQGALVRPDGARLLGVARRIAEAVGMVREDWNGFNVLHTKAARVGGLDLGFVPGPGGRDVAGILAAAGTGEIGAVILLGADEIDMNALGGAFVVYIGSHGDAGAHRADVILPAAAYTEKAATFVNTEGRVQHTHLAVFPPGEASEDWRIVRALSAELGRTLPYDSLDDLRVRLAAANPLFGRSDIVVPAAWGAFGAVGPLDPAPLASAVGSYYQADPISRSSPTMAACVAAFGGGCGHHHRTGTDA